MNTYRAGYSEQPIEVPPNYGAGVVADPYMLPTVIAGLSQFINSVGTGVSLSDGAPLDHVSAAITGTSTVNLLTVNGAGFLYNVITPNGDASASSVATVTINIDGISYVITTTAGMSATQRLLIGATIEANAMNARILAKIGKTAQSTHVIVPAIGYVASLAQARVRFNYFCSVDIKMSVTPAATGTHGNHGMVRFTSD